MQEEKGLSAPAIATLVVVAILGTGAIVLFAYQTWEFVNWLLPADNLLMKILAVICFDIFSYVWLAMRLFLGKRMEKTSKNWCLIAGIITFLLSLACSIVQMSIADAERFVTNISPNLVYTGDGFIIFALVVDIVTLLIVVDIEWPYISGERQRGTPSPRPRRESKAPTEALDGAPQPRVTVTPEQPPAAAALPSPALMTEFEEFLRQRQQTPVREVTGKIEAVQPTSPLAETVSLKSEGETEKPSQNGKHPK